MSKVGQIVKQRRKRHWTMPFGAGDKVVQKVDPRHVGRVSFAYATQVKVRWPNGWISEHHASELELSDDE